ncbi:hypothetical protein [Streptomyces qinzhouensis]|uniref:hypothetical protein n=1 Tax=Streptomyces qinzhouensis TaxID=2599401 RepID=UPI00164410AA|nr:hypothetical protein [Streptomyces qinzhouensis]
MVRRTPPPKPAPEPAPSRKPVRPVPAAQDLPAYRPPAAKTDREGMPLVVLVLVTTTPAVLAAALLKPRRGR